MRFCAWLLAFSSLASAVPQQALLLRQGWAVQSSADIREAERRDFGRRLQG